MGVSESDAPLIGVIDAGTRTVKFSVFRSQHIEEIAEHAIDIVPITPQEGWFEEKPKEILDAVKISMKKAVEKLGTKRESGPVNFY